jgi:hypothetical protein
MLARVPVPVHGEKGGGEDERWFAKFCRRLLDQDDAGPHEREASGVLSMLHHAELCSQRGRHAPVYLSLQDAALACSLRDDMPSVAGARRREAGVGHGAARACKQGSGSGRTNRRQLDNQAIAAGRRGSAARGDGRWPRIKTRL